MIALERLSTRPFVFRTLSNLRFITRSFANMASNEGGVPVEHQKLAGDILSK